MTDGKMSREYCLKTPLRKMGFSQKSSCKAQGYIKRTSRKMKGRYIVSAKYKSKNKSLYENGKKRSSVKSGYGNAKRAKETLKNIKGKSEIYQYQVVNTMYNRAKYHANQTKDMREAMKVFKEWIKRKKLKK